MALPDRVNQENRVAGAALVKAIAFFVPFVHHGIGRDERGMMGALANGASNIADWFHIATEGLR